MPTGYTYGIVEKDWDFPTFAKQCARAMGAFIMQRDDPSDAPLVIEEEPSDYPAKRLAAVTEELAALERMSEADARLVADGEYERAMESYRRMIADNEAETAKYQEMRAQVESWSPPTPEHQGLKDFMLQQIDISMDCYRPSEPIRQTGRDYLNERIPHARRLVQQYREEVAKEAQRVADRVKWKKDLLASLDQVSV